jgi:hypothetical protein
MRRVPAPWSKWEAAMTTFIEQQHVRDQRAIQRMHKQSIPIALLRRAEFLEPEDRRLIHAVFLESMSLCQIARLFGVNPGTISRRIQRVAARLYNPLVAALVEDHLNQRTLPPEARQLGIEHFLQGKSVRQLADLHQMTRRVVGKMLDDLKTWFKSGMVVPPDPTEQPMTPPDDFPA